jgi:hypothetical protein
MSSTQGNPPAGSGTSTGSNAPPTDTSRHVPRQAQRYDQTTEAESPSGAAIAFTTVAAVLLIMSGAWNILEGIAAIAKGSFFVVLPNYAYNLSVTGWGWFHLILGIVVLAAGIALFWDQWWARAVGVVVASLSALVNFLFIPYQPVWSIVIIALDAAVIWALLTPRRGWA